MPTIESSVGEVEQPARLVVDDDDGAGAVDGQHAIAHVSHHVAEKHVLLARCTVPVA